MSILEIVKPQVSIKELVRLRGEATHAGIQANKEDASSSLPPFDSFILQIEPNVSPAFG
jgi:hypothetical protein